MLTVAVRFWHCHPGVSWTWLNGIHKSLHPTGQWVGAVCGKTTQHISIDYKQTRPHFQLRYKTFTHANIPVVQQPLQEVRDGEDEPLAFLLQLWLCLYLVQQSGEKFHLVHFTFQISQKKCQQGSSVNIEHGQTT